VPHILTVDKGTSVVKAVLFRDDGVEVAVARRETNSTHPHPNWHEEDPEANWDVVVALVREVLATPQVPVGDIAAIGVTAHMSGLLLLDEQFRPVYPNVLWDDARAAGIVQEWQESGRMGDLFAVGGQAVLAGLTVPLVRWFATHRPELLDRARHLCTTKDYFVLRLTGVLGTDESDAGWMPGDTHIRNHSESIRTLCQIEPFAALFPPVRKSEYVVGGVTPEAARQLGIREGTPVIAGLGDANASTVGVGVVQPGQAVSIIGTSLLNNVVVDRPVMEPHGIGFVLPTVGGRWLRMLPNTGGGSVNLKWLVDLAYRGESDPYAVMDAEVRSEPLGAAGLFYHPYINHAGVVAPFYHIGARAQLTGLHVGSTRAAVARAVYEGVAMSLLDCYSATPVAISEVRLSGGAARSPVLCQTVADMLGRPVLVPTGEEAAAKGAAMVAGWGVGIYPDLTAAAERCVLIGHRYEPDLKNTAHYAERYALFREIRQGMGEVWTKRLPFEQ
jgi:sugar (pentulose or hexulose) kinase